MAKRAIPTVKMFDIPIGARSDRCRSCNQRVYWIETEKGRRMPVDLSHERSTAPTVSVAGQGTSHFISCPKAHEWKGHHRV